MGLVSNAIRYTKCMSNIEGTWRSRYEYGKGPNSEPQISEHTITFTTEEANKWVGKSLPQDDGSEVTLTLTQNGDEFKGDWQEHTSSTGSYGGQELGGAILLLLQAEGAELNGMWLGRSSSSNQVKVGGWTLRREVES